MATSRRPTPRGFTLIELLVVVAIIAMLISILLPSLRCAREKARAARCGVQLRNLGTGLNAYITEHNGWIPGINTSGVAARVAGRGGDAGLLRRPDTPIQSFDWISPVIRHETELGANRAQRLRTIMNEYACPSQAGLTIDFLYSEGLQRSPDRADFTNDIVSTYAPVSYLMPAHFQFWGQDYRDRVIAMGRSSAGRPIPIEAAVANPDWSAWHPGGYQSRLELVGPPGRKIAAADGTRYVLGDGSSIDIDINPATDRFGMFASNGAWWCGSQAYGVKNGTKNWNGTTVNSGSDQYPAAQGRNMVWSYRHGCVNRGAVTESVHDNHGEINALFFDGHVARLDDRASRQIEYWYPAGTVTNNGPLNGLIDVPNGYEVP